MKNVFQLNRSILTTLVFAAPLMAGNGDFTVPAGIYKWDGGEFYTPSFTIQSKVRLSRKPDETIGCELPGVLEWLAAASRPDFKPSGSYEMLTPPPMDKCNESEDEVEAEGVTGRIYFGGKGKSVPGDGYMIHSGKGERDLISSMNSSIYYFWGDESRPAPIGYRCLVKRDEPVKTEMYVNATSLNLRKGRGTNFPSYGLIPGRSKVTVLYKEKEWVFIHAEIRSSDCTYSENGWVSAEYLVSDPSRLKK